MFARRPGSSLGVAGGLLAAVGSLLTWGTVRLDLERVFGLFPPDYQQSLGGLELGGSLTLAGGVLVAAGAGTTLVRPRLAVPAGAACLGIAALALMAALSHAVRIRPLALERVARASGIAPESLAGADVTVGLGPFVVMAGALLAMAGGVLMVARGSD
ncbi:MAG: hypothetical protein WD770_10605 [Actinomycetota bacterium]